MKTKLFIFLAFCISASVFAQGPLKVSPGKTRSFQVNLMNGVALSLANPYTWTATNTLGTAITNKAAVDAAKTNSVSVTFGAVNGNTATLSVYSTSLNGCKSDLKSISLVVGPLDYIAAIAQATQDICPKSDADATQTGVPASIAITFGANPATGLSYSIDGVLQPAVTFASTTSYSLSIPKAFTGAESGDHTIEIVSVSGVLGTSLQDTGAAVQTIKVSVAPIINSIF